MSGNGHTPDPERPVPDVMLERYLAGDLSGEQRAQIEARCEASAELHERLEQLRQERAAFYAADPPALFAHRVAVRLAHASDVGVAARAKRRAWAWWAYLGAPSAAAAAAVLVAVTYGDLAEQGPVLPAAVQAPAVIGESEGVAGEELTPDAAADAPRYTPTEAGADGEVADELGVGLAPAAPEPDASPADRADRAEHRKRKAGGTGARPARPRVAKPRQQGAGKASGSRPKSKAAPPPAPPEPTAKKDDRGGKGGDVRRKRRRAEERESVSGDDSLRDNAGGAGAASHSAAPSTAAPESEPAPMAAEEDSDGADAGAADALDVIEESSRPTGPRSSHGSAPAGRPPPSAGASRAAGTAKTESTKEAKQAKPRPAVTAQLEVKRGSGWRSVTSGTVLRPGDVVRVSGVVRAAGYLAVVGLRSDGGRTVYHPAGGNAAVRVEAGSRVSGRPVEVRGQPASGERVYFLFAPTHFAIAPLLRDVRGRPGRLPFAGEQTVLDLRIEIEAPPASSPAAEPP